MAQHGGKREGAGGKINPGSKRQSGSRVGALLTSEAATTIRRYPQAQLFELLADGLRLGAGNLPELRAAERQIIQAALSGSVVDALLMRHLPDEVADMDVPGAMDLAAKLRGLGDWELLALVLGGNGEPGH